MPRVLTSYKQAKLRHCREQGARGDIAHPLDVFQQLRFLLTDWGAAQRIIQVLVMMLQALAQPLEVILDVALDQRMHPGQAVVFGGDGVHQLTTAHHRRRELLREGIGERDGLGLQYLGKARQHTFHFNDFSSLRRTA